MTVAQLAKRVRKAREALGISQRELDRRAGISMGLTRAIEQLGSRPRIDTLAKLAKALGKTVEEMVS